MKMMIVSDAAPPQRNGVVTTYTHLARELESAGHTVRLYTPQDCPRTIPLPGYREIRLALPPYTGLRQALDAFAPDALHIATEGPLGWAARAYALRQGWAFTTAWHTRFPDYVALRVARWLPPLASAAHTATRALLRRFHAPSSRIFVSTQRLQDSLASEGFTAPCHLVTRGVDPAIFHPAPPEQKTRQGAIYVGRISPEKNLTDFLALPYPAQKTVIGDGPDRPALQEKFRNVEFKGSLPPAELAEHLRSAELFVFPSKTDTFGIVIIEALACGLPVAAYPVPGPLDILTEPELGAMDEDLLTAVRSALASPGTQETRANHVRARYSWPLAAQQFLSGLTPRVPDPAWPEPPADPSAASDPPSTRSEPYRDW